MPMKQCSLRKDEINNPRTWLTKQPLSHEVFCRDLGLDPKRHLRPRFATIENKRLCSLVLALLLLRPLDVHLPSPLDLFELTSTRLFLQVSTQLKGINLLLAGFFNFPLVFLHDLCQRLTLFLFALLKMRGTTEIAHGGKKIAANLNNITDRKIKPDG
jgi:hypothetical protein